MEITTCLLYAFICYVVYQIIEYLYRLPQIGSLSSRYVLITGCDTGFGHELAKRLDKRGCHVFAGCLTESGETKLKKISSSRLKAFHMNVAEPESVKRAFDMTNRTIPSGSGMYTCYFAIAITLRRVC